MSVRNSVKKNKAGEMGKPAVSIFTVYQYHLERFLRILIHPGTSPEILIYLE